MLSVTTILPACEAVVWLTRHGWLSPGLAELMLGTSPLVQRLPGHLAGFADGLASVTLFVFEKDHSAVVLTPECVTWADSAGRTAAGQQVLVEPTR
jgi:hypothetical protein